MTHLYITIAHSMLEAGLCLAICIAVSLHVQPMNAGQEQLDWERAQAPADCLPGAADSVKSLPLVFLPFLPLSVHGRVLIRAGMIAEQSTHSLFAISSGTAASNPSRLTILVQHSLQWHAG